MLAFDWGTFSFQVVNFLVLLLILNRFLYRPALAMIDERRRRIATELDRADAAKREGDAVATALQADIARLHQDVETERQKAGQAAADLRQRLEADLQADIARQRAAAERAIADRQQEAIARLQQEMGTIVLAGLTAVFRDLPGIEVADALLDRFLQRLAALPDGDWQRLADGSSVTVAAAQPLTPDQRARLTEALGRRLTPLPACEYVTDPTLLGGYRLRSESYTVDGSLQRLVDDLAGSYRQKLEAARDGSP